MEFLKTDPSAIGLREIDGEILVFANEGGTLAYSEFYSIKTGVAVAIPPGKVGLLLETAAMGSRGITLTGKCITCLDMSELRVGFFNGSRTAFPFTKGQQIAQLLLLDADDMELKECVNTDKVAAIDLWAAEMKKRKDNNTEKSELAINKYGTGKNSALTAPEKPTHGPGSLAHQEEMVPTGEKVDQHNVAKNSATNEKLTGNTPGTPPTVPGAVLGATKDENKPKTL